NESQNLLEFRLTIAITPTDTFLTALHTRATELVGTDTIINLRIDKSILGGAIVSFHGKYSNNSLSKKTRDYFDHKRQLMNEHRDISDLFVT
ncbi:F0F1 ATP synthase subunit delta, partial [candidate division WWE3 bacterium]|nr:F0F1 ATP synthase subunit delta [candidate division WWE3 bacterium]